MVAVGGSWWLSQLLKREACRVVVVRGADERLVVGGGKWCLVVGGGWWLCA